MNNIKIKGERLKVKGFFYLLSIFIFQFSFSSCNPNAKWETENVEITMNITIISAGFVRCEFSTNKEAYYLVACEPVRGDENPMDRQKQFMTLALDSAYVTYLEWRHDLLEQGETHIAPFESHALNYGKVGHTFTQLVPDSAYWIYAFVVNPLTMTPSGRLYITPVQTADSSTVDVHFEYRVKGSWDYIYPLDSLGSIVDYYPYIAASCDSAETMDIFGQTPDEYFWDLFNTIYKTRELLEPSLRYGIDATDNSYFGTGYETFEEGHVYYTAMVGCDGFLGKISMFRFKWTGEKFEAYFTDEDNLVFDGEDG